MAALALRQGRTRLAVRLCLALVAAAGLATWAGAGGTQTKAVRPAVRPPEGPKKAAPGVAVPPGDLGTVVTWLTGDFSNQAQAPLRGITPGGSEKQPQDQVHVRVRRVRAPAIGEVVLYVQWNRDRAAGTIARQRLWSLSVEGGTPALRTYALVDPEPYVDALESPDVLETLAIEDLVAPDASCVMSFTRSGDAFMATTLPSCTAPGSGGRTLTLQIRLRVTRDGFTYSESGYGEPDFTLVFALPSEGSYEFLRSKP